MCIYIYIYIYIYILYSALLPCHNALHVIVATRRPPSSRSTDRSVVRSGLWEPSDPQAGHVLVWSVHVLVLITC